MSGERRDDPFTELYGEFRDRLRGDRWQPDVDVFETDEEEAEPTPEPPARTVVPLRTRAAGR